MSPTLRHLATLALVGGTVPGWSAAQAVKCSDLLPINPEVVTKEMKYKAFGGGNMIVSQESDPGREPAQGTHQTVGSPR